MKNFLYTAIVIVFLTACGVKPNSVDAPQDGRTAGQSSIAQKDILNDLGNSDVSNDKNNDAPADEPGAAAPIITPSDSVFPRRYPTR